MTEAQPARQPEAVAAGLIGDDNPVDRVAGLRRFIAPTMQELQEGVAVCIEFLLRIAFEPWHDAGNQPTRLAQLDDGDQCRVLFKRDEGPAEVVKLPHEALHWPGLDTQWCHSLAARPI